MSKMHIHLSKDNIISRVWNSMTDALVPYMNNPGDLLAISIFLFIGSTCIVGILGGLLYILYYMLLHAPSIMLGITCCLLFTIAAIISAKRKAKNNKNDLSRQ